MKYNVSYIRNDITHANLADANSPIAVRAWYISPTFLATTATEKKPFSEWTSTSSRR